MTDAPKYLTSKIGTGPWLHPPRKTPTPPNLARPSVRLFATTAIVLAVLGAVAWIWPMVVGGAL